MTGLKQLFRILDIWPSTPMLIALNGFARGEDCIVQIVLAVWLVEKRSYHAVSARPKPSGSRLSTAALKLLRVIMP